MMTKITYKICNSFLKNFGLERGKIINFLLRNPENNQRSRMELAIIYPSDRDDYAFITTSDLSKFVTDDGNRCEIYVVIDKKSLNFIDEARPDEFIGIKDEYNYILADINGISSFIDGKNKTTFREGTEFYIGYNRFYTFIESFDIDLGYDKPIKTFFIYQILPEDLKNMGVKFLIKDLEPQLLDIDPALKEKVMKFKAIVPEKEADISSFYK